MDNMSAEDRLIQFLQNNIDWQILTYVSHDGYNVVAVKNDFSRRICKKISNLELVNARYPEDILCSVIDSIEKDL